MWECEHAIEYYTYGQPEERKRWTKNPRDWESPDQYLWGSGHRQRAKLSSTMLECATSQESMHAPMQLRMLHTYCNPGTTAFEMRALQTTVTREKEPAVGPWQDCPPVDQDAWLHGDQIAVLLARLALPYEDVMVGDTAYEPWSFRAWFKNSKPGHVLTVEDLENGNPADQAMLDEYRTNWIVEKAHHSGDLLGSWSPCRGVGYHQEKKGASS